LWAERYDRDLEDIFAVQDEITQTIVAALLPELTRSEIERARKKPPENLDAWDLYQRGLWHLFRNTKDDMAAARQLFEQAIDADPGFMNPYAGILECDAHDITFGYAERDPRESFAPARKAVELDPQSAAAHKALGMAHYLNRDHPSAISELKLAIQLNPNDAHIYPYLGFAQAWSGHAEEALENFLTAIRLSPHDPRFGWFHNGMGVSYLHLQRHEDCITWVRKALRYPDAGWPIRSYLISALAHLDRMDECKQEVHALLDLHPDCTISGLQRSRLTTYQPYTDHYLAGLRKAGLPEGKEVREKKPALPDKPSIAVLPFDNLSGDPEQEYFADGIAEDIITSLSKFHWFFVIARNSCFSYKGTSPDVRRVAEELGVRYVLEGSVRKGGNRVRITAQLVDALTGHHVWADRYDRDLEDIFAVQDEITQAIVGEVAPSFISAEAKRVEHKKPESLDVWDYILRGNWHLSRRGKEGNSEAQRMFETALELDPNSSMALSGLALALGYKLSFGSPDDVEETRTMAYRAARRAVELDDKNAGAHEALGLICMLMHNLDSAVAACQRAIELNPNFAVAEAWLAIALAWRGNYDDAIQHSVKATRLDPHHAITIGSLARAVAEFGAQHYEQALEWAKKTTEIAPDFPAGWRYFAASLAHLDRLEEARHAGDQLLRVMPHDNLRLVRTLIPSGKSDLVDRFAEGLRIAGLPE
jgi:TolB-like protein/Flp pilus assembly protein TadD